MNNDNNEKIALNHKDSDKNTPEPTSEGVEIPVQIIEKEKSTPKTGPSQLRVVSQEEGKEEKTVDILSQDKQNEEVEEIKEQEAPQEDPLEIRDKRIKELEEQVKRLSAEFENFRRRQERQMDDFKKYSEANVLCEFIPFLDSLEMANKMIRTSQEKEGILKGLDLINKQLQKTLEKFGVEELDNQGQPFDHNINEAVMVEETHAHPDETVLQTFQKGYRYKERVLRPSRVKVAKNDADPPSPPPAGEKNISM